MEDIQSKITFYKSKDDKDTDADITFDAINSYICDLDNCKELRFNNYYYINNKQQFEIKENIYCKLTNLEIAKDNVNAYSLEIYSDVLSWRSDVSIGTTEPALFSVNTGCCCRKFEP